MVEWIEGLLLKGWLRFDSRSGQTNDYKNSYSQLSCMMFSNKKGQCEAFTVCGRQVGRWQLDSKTERSLRCLLIKAAMWINCNYNYKKQHISLQFVDCPSTSSLKIRLVVSHTIEKLCTVVWFSVRQNFNTCFKLQQLMCTYL